MICIFDSVPTRVLCSSKLKAWKLHHKSNVTFCVNKTSADILSTERSDLEAFLLSHK